MLATPNLPRTKRLLARLIHDHVQAERARHSYTRAMWQLCHAYLCGARRFHLKNLSGDSIESWFLDKDGNLLYQSPDMLSMIDRVSARLSSMDLSPSVVRHDRSLASIRQRSAAQVIADAIVAPQDLPRIKQQFAHIFTALGSCGLYGAVEDHPVAGLTLDLEVVHPCEIYPLTAQHREFVGEVGIIRNHIVPLDWLESRLGRSIPRAVLESDCVAWRQRVTDPLVSDHQPDVPLSPSVLSSDADASHVVIEISQTWVYGPRRTVARYIVSSGEHVILDEDYEADGREVYCPMAHARFMDNGTFHGAGVFTTFFSLVRHDERLMASLFANVANTDQYGVVVMPSGSWNQNMALRDIGSGLRVLPYEPDVAAENFRPFVVTPFTTGDVPGKTAAFARQVLRELSPVRDLADEKGRVDSAAGLQFLDEQMHRAMTNPSAGVQQCFGDAYRAGVAAAATLLTTSPRSLPVSRLDLSLVGAVLDDDGDRVSFPKNPVPRVGQLHFTVREVAPRSPAVRKAEAVQMLQLQSATTGRGDWDSFLLFSVREGIDMAVDTGLIRAAYTTIVSQILRLFNDGETPGRIIETPHLARPDIQLRILDEFMAGPEIRQADVAIQNAFIEYRQFLLEHLTVVLPEGVPTLDDAALMSTMQQASDTPPTVPTSQGRPPAQGR